VRNQDDQFQVLGWDNYTPDQQEIKRDLMAWMRCVRSIPNDGPTLKRCWKLVPLFFFEKSQTKAQVTAYRNLVKPDQSLYHRSIVVEDGMKGWREPDGRWRLQWVEGVYELPRTGGLGKLIEKRQQAAILLVTRQKPTKKTQIEIDGEPANPLGLYITQLGWSD